MLKLLSVPHRLQLDDGYCLPACVQMVLAYYGVERDQQSLAQRLQVIPKRGTSGSRVLLLVSEKLDVVYRSGELEDLQVAIASDVPPIALVRTDQLSYWSEMVFHAVVVTGFDGNTIVFNDSAMSTPDIRVFVAEFLLA